MQTIALRNTTTTVLLACLCALSAAAQEAAPVRVGPAWLLDSDFEPPLPADVKDLIERHLHESSAVLAESRRKIETSQRELIARLKELLREYAARPDVAEAIAWRIKHFQQQLGEDAEGERPNLAAMRGPLNIGRTLELRITGALGGEVWGSGVYTDDSDLGTAAVHAGILKPGETAQLGVVILPGLESYLGSEAHGVTSRSYGRWYGSFALVPPVQAVAFTESGHLVIDRSGSVEIRPAHPAAPPSMHQVEAEIGRRFVYAVTGATEGSVWGSEIYTDDSSIAAAAVHAGLLRSGETAAIKVTLLPGRNAYSGADRNGVSSSSYGSWGRSYMLERVDAGNEARPRFRIYGIRPE